MRRAFVLLSISIAACKRDVPAPANGDASALVSPGPSTATTPLEDLVPPESADIENPRVKIGKVVVWGVEDGDATRIVAKVAGGKPKLLRRTSGKVKAFDAIDVGDDIVVAWASELAAGGTQVIAVVTASGDLAKVTPPTTVAMVAAPIQLEGHVAVAKNPKGGVIVVHQGPAASCKLVDQMTECLTFEVKAVSASGVVTKLASEKLHGGPSPEYRLLDVDAKALAVLGSSMRGGRSLAGIVVAYDANDPKPAFTVPICGGNAAHFPELLRGANGEIVSLCFDSRFDNPKCGKPLRGDGDRCLRVSAVTLDGKDLAPAVKGRTAAVQKVECGEGGRPRLVLDGAAPIELAGNPEVVRDFTPTCPK